ncbi:MAG: PIN domain-containing protein [Chloroherpetonaceae bacterium]
MKQNNRYFIDTSYIIALEISDDQHHSQALSHWNRLISKPIYLVTTSYVFDEIVTFFNTRRHHSKALEIGGYLLDSPSVNMVFVDETLFHEAWQYFQKHSDKKFSLTDCLSFLVMQKFQINTALTFDKHFSQAGFKVQPTQR